MSGLNFYLILYIAYERRGTCLSFLKGSWSVFLNDIKKKFEKKILMKWMKPNKMLDIYYYMREKIYENSNCMIKISCLRKMMNIHLEKLQFDAMGF